MSKIPEKLHLSAVEFRESHQVKRLRGRRNSSPPFPVECLPPGIMQTKMSKVRAQRIRRERYPAGVNKRGDPCTAGKVVMKVKNKPSPLDPFRSSHPCQRAVTMLKRILRRKPVSRPVRNFLSVVYNA